MNNEKPGTKRYTPCRWYDPYPRLVFSLKLLEMMPLAQQEAAGERLLSWLQRTMPKHPPVASPTTTNRWYDQTQVLHQALHTLQMAPPPLIQQGSDVLDTWLQAQQPPYRWTSA